MIKKNKISHLNSWNLHQLAQAVAKNKKDIPKAWHTIYKAYSLAKIFKKQIDKHPHNPWSCIQESLQIATLAVANMSLDLSTTVATILAPPFLNNLIQQETIEKYFCVKTASILAELKKLQHCKIQNNIIAHYLTFPDINSPYILAVLLQICNIIRLHCNNTVQQSKSNILIHSSTQFLLDIKRFYIPLLHRMRIYNLQNRLADVWFNHTNTLNYYFITTKLNMTKLQRQKKLDLIAEEICNVIQEHGINFIMKKRIKAAYSIWHKIQNLKIDFDQIYDLAAIRIIITGMDDKAIAEEKIVCWKIFTIISELYKPIYHIMRDWVSTPKENGYESIHLTFETTKHGQLEIQIRTARMDYIAEHGNAAHWKYKHNTSFISSAL